MSNDKTKKLLEELQKQDDAPLIWINKKMMNGINGLQEKINKAIEYLEKKSKESDWFDTDFMVCINILKGEDNSE